MLKPYLLGPWNIWCSLLTLAPQARVEFPEWGHIICERSINPQHREALTIDMLENPEKPPGTLENIIVTESSEALAKFKELYFTGVIQQKLTHEKQMEKFAELLSVFKLSKSVVGSGNHCTEATTNAYQATASHPDTKEIAESFFKSREYCTYALTVNDLKKRDIYKAFKVVNAVSNNHVVAETSFHERLINGIRSAWVLLKEEADQKNETVQQKGVFLSDILEIIDNPKISSEDSVITLANFCSVSERV